MNAVSNQAEPVVASNGAGHARINYLTPYANILETKEEFILEAEMPGISKDGLEVTVADGELTIWGRQVAKELPGRVVYRESRALDYRRTFELDSSIDTAKITAKMDQGVLVLHLPKADAVKPRKIAITD